MQRGWPGFSSLLQPGKAGETRLVPCSLPGDLPMFFPGHLPPALSLLQMSDFKSSTTGRGNLLMGLGWEPELPGNWLKSSPQYH